MDTIKYFEVLVESVISASVATILCSVGFSVVPSALTVLEIDELPKVPYDFPTYALRFKSPIVNVPYPPSPPSIFINYIIY